MNVLPEIREADAPAEIAAIYAEIKAASGLPLVNLIWRHFAAMPGVLPWAWAAVAPLVRSGSMEQARRRITDGIALPALPLVPIAEWHEAAPGDVEAVMAIAEAYARGNLTNLIALTALRLRLERPDVAAGSLAPALPPPARPAGLAPLPRLVDLSPEVAGQVRDLAARHGGAGDVIPSLYLHLAHWPGVLAALPRWLGAIYAPDQLEALRAATRALAEAEATQMLPFPSHPPPGSEAAVLGVLTHFTRQVIPDLLPLCLALVWLSPTNQA